MLKKLEGLPQQHSPNILTIHGKSKFTSANGIDQPCNSIGHEPGRWRVRIGHDFD
jgi:hypothetical protein